jgi:hypothetical protein
MALLDTWPTSSTPGSVAAVNSAVAALQTALSAPIAPYVNPGPTAPRRVPSPVDIAALTGRFLQLQLAMQQALAGWEAFWSNYGNPPS